MTIILWLKETILFVLLIVGLGLFCPRLLNSNRSFSSLLFSYFIVQNVEISGNWLSFLSNAKHEVKWKRKVQRRRKYQSSRGLGILAWEMLSPITAVKGGTEL